MLASYSSNKAKYEPDQLLASIPHFSGLFPGFRPYSARVRWGSPRPLPPFPTVLDDIPAPAF
jgi:hypothetical protein